MNYNLIILACYISRDPESRYTPKGTAVTGFGLGVNRMWNNDAGERQTEVSFFECEAWAKTAEVISQHFRKGMPIHVTGRLKLDSWEDKQTGQKRSRVKIIVESFQFVAAKSDEQRTDSRPPLPTKPEDVAEGHREVCKEDDGLPF